MNFLQRRKILKHVNFLDLHPIRQMQHEMRDDGCINILLPRFSNRIVSAMFQPAKKDHTIRIRLDRFGSQAWLLIDGEATVSELAGKLEALFPEELKPEKETSERVTGFLSLLYRERYITFREIQDKTGDQQ